MVVVRFVIIDRAKMLDGLEKLWYNSDVAVSV